MKQYTLRELVSVLNAEDRASDKLPSDHAIIDHFVSSSAAVRAGSLFVAIKGQSFDGHDYIETAINAGAIACVVQRDIHPGVPCLVVADTRVALSRLAALFNDEPSRDLKLIGITGTNGKTTINWIVYYVLNRLGIKCFRIGTLGLELPGVRVDPDSLTTPAATNLQSLMREAVSHGIEAGVLEVSSHALSQARVQHVDFDVGVFTNLTHDHLDYHHSLENYFEAKRQLFLIMSQSKKKCRTAVINLDDAYGARLCQELPSLGLNNYSFGCSESAFVQIKGFNHNVRNSTLELSCGGQTLQHTSCLIGFHNAQNISAALAVGMALGFEAWDVLRVLEDLPQVPGRLQSVGQADFAVFIDYAHTPDALENVLRTLYEIKQNRLWVVFGCGGDRDRAKRPEMGHVAARYADMIVVTSDNPRSEDPDVIIADILGSGIQPAFTNVDRRCAIDYALSHASKGDIVLIAGKGHEDYQIIGAHKNHFSDVEEATRILESLAP